MKFLRLRPTTVVLFMLCAMYFITYLDRVNVSTAAVGFGKEFNLTKTEIGIVFSAFAYPYLIFQIIGHLGIHILEYIFFRIRTIIFCFNELSVNFNLKLFNNLLLFFFTPQFLGNKITLKPL